MPWAAIAAAAIPVVAGAIGAHQGKKGMQNAEETLRQGLGRIQELPIPDIEKQKLSLELMQYLGDYSPTMEGIETLGPSGYEQIAVDPRLQQDQMAALEQLGGLAQGGLSAADLAGLEQVRRGAAAESQAKQGQILQEMAQRGQAGGGAELIARLKAAQSGADRQSAEGLAIARMAQERALQALTGEASLAGQIRGQEYGEQSDLARARDVVNQFNVQNRQAVGQRNVGMQNQAALRNLETKQQQANQNVGLRNQEQMYNKELLQKQFENRLQKEAALQPGYKGIAAQQAEIGKAAAAGATGAGAGAGGLVSAIFK